MLDSLRFFRQRGMVALVALWTVATLVLLCSDRASAVVGVSIGAFVGAVVLLGHWLLPRGADDPPGVFRQTASRENITIRSGVVAVAYAAACLLPLGLTGVQPWRHLLAFLTALHTGLPRGALAPYVTATFVVIPALLLGLLGARFRDFGIARARPGTWKYVLGWTFVPLVVCVVSVLSGRLSLLGVIAVLVENVLLNGLPEEFLFRGVVLSLGRRLVPTDWAFFGQAVLFSLFHYGITIGQEHGHALLACANVISENVPVAVLFGVMALRSRSLALPIALHFAFDAMRTLVRS